MSKNISNISSAGNKISPSQIPAILDLHAKVTHSKVPLFIGLPGISKTTQVTAWSAKNNYDLFQFMAPHYLPQDIKGYGVPDHENGRMKFLPTNELPWGSGTYADVYGRTGRKAFVFCDESLNATPSVFNLLQQMLHERRIGDNPLVSDVFFAAAGNSADMRCNSNKLTLALADRFAIYEIMPDAREIISWMEQYPGFNPWVLAFLQSRAAMNQGGMWTMDIGKWNGKEPIDSARSFTKLSDVLGQLGNDNDLAGHPLLTAVSCGHIGEAAGRSLVEFINLSVHVGDIPSMLKKPETCKLPDRPDIKWGVAARLVHHLTDKTWDQVRTLCRRLTPEDMRPNDDTTPTIFEAFTIRSFMNSPNSVRYLKALGDKHANFFAQLAAAVKPAV